MLTEEWLQAPGSLKLTVAATGRYPILHRRFSFPVQYPIMKDSQKNRVYAWENFTVAPHDRTDIPFDQIQSIVDYVWAGRGLEYPPQVMPKYKKKTKTADATRVTVRFGEKTRTWVILHELAHSMTSTVDGRSNYHGALFMGIYLQLLRVYLKLDLFESAKQAGLHVKPDAIPVFLENL